MERLTKKGQLAGNTVNYVGVDNCFDVRSVPKKFTGNAIDRLAAYEDTGLEPEEIEKAMSDCADTVANNQFAIRDIKLVELERDVLKFFYEEIVRFNCPLWRGVKEEQD